MLIILKISWLATWFIFELIGVGPALDLSEQQAFKNVSLQMMIGQTFTFQRIFFQKITPHSSFVVRYELPKRPSHPWYALNHNIGQFGKLSFTQAICPAVLLLYELNEF